LFVVRSVYLWSIDYVREREREREGEGGRGGEGDRERERENEREKMILYNDITMSRQ
jgi:hypothetical protein